MTQDRVENLIDLVDGLLWKVLVESCLLNRKLTLCLLKTINLEYPSSAAGRSHGPYNSSNSIRNTNTSELLNAQSSDLINGNRGVSITTSCRGCKAFREFKKFVVN